MKRGFDRRAATPEDAHELAALRAQCLGDLLTDWQRAREDHTAALPGEHVHLVLEHAGAIAASLALIKRRHEVELLELLVSPQHRSQGIASALLREVLDEAMRRDVSVRIDVPPRATPLLRLLRFLGFVVVPSPRGAMVRLVWRV